MKKRMQFNASTHIQSCVTIVASGEGEYWEGEASWRTLNGSCSVSLCLIGGVFSAANFKVTHPDPEMGRWCQEKGLGTSAELYLKSIFIETIKNGEETSG